MHLIYNVIELFSRHFKGTDAFVLIDPEVSEAVISFDALKSASEKRNIRGFKAFVLAVIFVRHVGCDIKEIVGRYFEGLAADLQKAVALQCGRKLRY